MLNSNLKRAILSKRFVIAVILLALFEYMDVFRMIYENMRYQLYDSGGGYTLVDLLLSTGNTMFWGMSITVALLPYSCSFVEDENNNSITYMSIRSDKCLYSIATVMACGISAFICTIMGKSLFLAVSSMTCEPCNQYTLEVYGNYITSLSNGDYWGFIIGNVILSGLKGSFFALIGLLISSFVKNKMVIFATPVLTYFFFIKFGYYNLHLPKYFDIIAIYMTYVFEEKYEILSIVYAFAFTVCVGILTIYMINKKLRRSY